jgi:hypothetical protein
MFCTECGAELPDDAMFCTECGHRVEDASMETTGSEETEATNVLPVTKPAAEETGAGASAAPVATPRSEQQPAAKPEPNPRPASVQKPASQPEPMSEPAGGAGSGNNVVTCPKCGAPVDDGSSFCVMCGAPLFGASGGPAADRAYGPGSTMELPVQQSSRYGRQQGGYRQQPQAVAQQQVPQNTKKSMPTALIVVISALVVVLVVALLTVFSVGPFSRLHDMIMPEDSQTQEESTDASSAESTESTSDTTSADESTSDTTSADSTASTSGTTSTDSTTSTSGSTVAVSGQGINDPNGYIIPNSASTYLTESDLANLTDQELYYARNEIYARHGRGFNTPELQSYFNGKTWYHYTIPPESFTDSMLSDCELSNAKLIRSVEEARGSAYLQ